MLKSVPATVVMVTYLLLSAFIACAADSVVRGRVEKLEGSTLYILDYHGEMQSVHLNAQTVTVRRDTKRKSDWKRLVPGSRINVVVQRGNGLSLVIEEVPR